MQIHQESFQKLFKNAINPGAWTAALNRFMPDYGIDTFNRVTAFLAQCGHESQGFTRLIENMNYSATGLISTWPKRFDTDTANKYARQPEKIANRVYANRLGNGNEASGDGWRNRGHGLIQLTGHDNLDAFARHAGMSLDSVRSYLLTCEGATHAACWFWQSFGCNELADIGNMEKLTKRINGGLNGLRDRNELFALAVKIFRGDGLA